MSLCTTIASLPHELVQEICRLSIAPNLGHWPFGGNVAQWESNETIACLRLVCRAWSDPALRACLDSVSLFNQPSTEKFLALIQAEPRRPSLISHLALGVSEETYSNSEHEEYERILTESHDMIQVIALASRSLTHLHPHPMHFGARDRLLSAIRQCRVLHTLVISPRFLSYEGTSWGKDAFSSTDVVEFALPPLLHRLELDFASSWSAPFPALVPDAHPNTIRSLWLNCDCEESALWQVLSRSESLELLQLYFERLLPIEGTTRALMTLTSTIKRLHYMSNPTLASLVDFDPAATPIFDLLLPHYRQLSHLSVTATELSPHAVFRLLPRSLVHLEVTSLNDAPGRRFLDDDGDDATLVRDLDDDRVEITLRELVLHDDATAYDAALVARVRDKCRTRGVKFTFCPDSPAPSR